MPAYSEVVQNGEKVDEWKRGIVVEYDDKYFWIDSQEEKIVMEGNFL
mgnify:CR=1 FL=1